MTRRLLLLIAFVEGFASLGIEITALRRLVPYLGSSITITAPTIGLFLVALALGYRSGARVGGDFLGRLLRNFLCAALIGGIGLSPWALRLLFGASGDVMVGYLLFMGLVVCPAAWLLAQTVPLISNLVEADRAGEASGLVLAASTAGSVIGASALPLLVMPRFGVSAAGWICSASLVLAVLLASRGRLETGAGVAAGGGVGSRAAALGRWLAAPVVVLVATALVNLAPGPSRAETAYADYGLTRVSSARISADLTDPLRVFLVNNQWASILDSAEPPRPTPYIERIRAYLIDDLHLRDRRILVLGAGGFTLSMGEPSNHYLYVDVDPAIRDLAERHFLEGPIHGDFIADDARHFLLDFDNGNEARFDAIVVDVYSSHASVPAHLTTLEFWQLVPGALVDGGVVVINLILDPKLHSTYARNLLATIEAALGRCAIDVLKPAAPVASNVLVQCRPEAARLAPPVGRAGDDAVVPMGPVEPAGGTPSIYSDERNRADRDRRLIGY